MGITGTVKTAAEVRDEIREAVRDGALDPEFVDHINMHLADGDSYRRFVNTAAIMFAAYGDQFLINIGVDPESII